LCLCRARRGLICGKLPAMHGSNRKRQRLVGLFLLGCLLFNYPLLEIFDARTTVLGVPLLYAYLFAAWAALIALVAYVVERTD
jgi:hypothetical protein